MTDRPVFIEDADGQLINLAHVARIRAKCITLLASGEEWEVWAEISGFARSTLCRGLSSEAEAEDWIRTEFGAAIQGTSA